MLFCWPIFPCNVEQACLYVTYLAQRLKVSSVKTYYQAVVFYHVCAGIEPVRCSNPVLCTTLKGIEKCKGAGCKGKDPILPEHLKLIVQATRMSSELEMLVCVAALFMFRALFRVSHVVSSSHSLKRGDVVFLEDACFVRVKSSKTTSQSNDPVIIPLSLSGDSSICATTWLKVMLSRFKPTSSDLLFSSPSIPVLTYIMFSKKFKEITTRAGLVGDFASHSLRRWGSDFHVHVTASLRSDQVKGTVEVRLRIPLHQTTYVC